MKGWVYVIANKGMRDVVKIGMTTRTPEERAREFDGTHAPFRYTVEYSVQVNDPQHVEHAVHQELARLRVNSDREWFKCSTEQAIATIRRVSEEAVRFERRRELERLEELRLEAERTARQKEQHRAQILQAELRAYKDGLRAAARARYELHVKPSSSVGPWGCILAGIGVVMIGLIAVGAPTGVAFFFAILTGLVPAGWIMDIVERRRQKSPSYQSATAELQRELDVIESLTSVSSRFGTIAGQVVAPTRPVSQVYKASAPGKIGEGAADSQIRSSQKKRWTYDRITGLLRNNLTGMEYTREMYRRSESHYVNGFEILHGRDVWVSDMDIEIRPLPFDVNGAKTY